MLNLLVELRKFPFLATHQLYNNNQDKRFFDLFFFLVGWMSDGMTDMNGGEDTEAGLRRIWNREEPLIINITHISPHNNVLCPNPIFTDCLTFYPLDISTLQLSSSVINHAFLVFGPNFLSFSMYPSFQFHSILHRYKPTMPEKVVWDQKLAVFSVSSALEIVSKLEEIFYSGCAVSSLIVRLGGTLDRLCCRGWGDANQHLLLEISNYTICS